jgi:capsid portal protein
VLLSEAATLFRRNYYINGNHAGYILLTYDLPIDVNKDLANKIKSGHAPGNFSNYFIGAQSKNGQRAEQLKDKVQVLPIGEIGQKDDYERIKNVTRIEIFGMQRIQPALAAMIPDSSSGFGDIEKISRVNYENEVIPMQQIFEEINDYLPSHKWIVFDEPSFIKEEEA